MLYLAVFLLYVAPMLLLVGGGIYAIFDAGFSQRTGIKTPADVLMFVVIGLIPVLNLWLTVYGIYEVAIKDWWKEAKNEYLHRLLHD